MPNREGQHVISLLDAAVIASFALAVGTVIGVLAARPNRRQREVMERLRALAMLLRLGAQQRELARMAARDRAQTVGHHYLDERLRMVQALKRSDGRG